MKNEKPNTSNKKLNGFINKMNSCITDSICISKLVLYTMYVLIQSNTVAKSKNRNFESDTFFMVKPPWASEKTKWNILPTPSNKRIAAENIHYLNPFFLENQSFSSYVILLLDGCKFVRFPI